jgi:hypothetical protein
MTNEYEVIEIGKAQEVILGEKQGIADDELFPRLVADSDLDD